MKIQFLKSATTVIQSRGIQVLTDPWLVDGEYYGSWFHYPPFDFQPTAFSNVDYIYISHIHPDHFSRQTLQSLPKTIPVLIHQFAAKFLKRNIESLGFRVVELEHNQPFDLGNGLSINILAADGCNPELCNKMFGCGLMDSKGGSVQIDSLAIFDDGDFRVLNLNDCPFELAKSVAPTIQRQYDSIDFMLVGYAGAGPYPQCFSNLDADEKRLAAEKKKKQFLESGRNYVKLFRPRYFMPFAGTYTLGGPLAKLNCWRGVAELEEAAHYLADETDSTAILLNSTAEFDLSTESASAPYQPQDPFQRQNYIENQLLHCQYEFEADAVPSFDQFAELIPQAVQRMTEVRERIGFQSETRVLIPLVDHKTLVLSLRDDSYQILENDLLSEFERYVKLSVDARLLYRILRGPQFAHWNNAEIGSHITYHRVPNEFERGVYYCMNFFYAGAVPIPKLKAAAKPLVQIQS